MQDCYTGDIGDFGKYGLLRALCPKTADNFGPFLPLGVVWYLFPNEKNADGRLIGYLKKDRWNLRDCDRVIYNKLKKIVITDKDRRVKRIKEDDVLPSCRNFYEEKLEFKNTPVFNATIRNQRKESREKWLEGAYDAMTNCEVVFVDPDNGLEVKSTPKLRKKGPKYTFFDDLKCYWEHDKSLVIYQHLNMEAKKEKQLRYRIEQIKAHFKPYFGGLALYYKRGKPRFFIVLPSKKHKGVLFNRAKHFCNGPWGQHFDLFEI